jgi:integrase
LRLAKQAPTRPHALTPEEVELVRPQMPTLHDVCLLGLLAYAGLRPGEVLALRWRDVGRVLVIDRSVSDGEIRQTKTNTRRTVDVIPPLAADLDLLRPKVADPDALVIHGERGQVRDLNNWRARTWKTACEAASVRTTPYDGRHSYASLLIHEGRSLPYVTAALGHASATTTLNHSAHVFDEAGLATGAPMIEAVETARGLLEARHVYPVCTRDPIRVLRSAPKAARTA